MRAFFVSATVGLALFPAAAQAAPGDMAVSSFLEKAERLQKKGALALLSSDFKALKSETESAAQAYRAKIRADKAAGRQPQSCPPPKGKVALNSKDWMAHLRSYPASRRSGTNLKVAFSDMMKKRYPCS